MQANAAGAEPLAWHSPLEAPFQIAGFAWFHEEKLYRSLPRAPRHALREAVDHLADHTAGGQIRFRTDSNKLSIKVELKAPEHMAHMPSTGHSGFDVYLGPPGALVYCNTTKFWSTTGSYEVPLFDLPGASVERDVTLFFPLYNGVRSVFLGLAPGAKVRAPAPFASAKPVVIYGTSITQGGCASRPGMAWTNILSRRLHREIVNLGFSGNGKGDPELARLMAEIRAPACYVLDYESNCTEPGRLEETFPAFIRILRKAHPDVPILALSRAPTIAERFDPAVRETRLRRLAFQRETVESLRADGDEKIFFEPGSGFLGEDFHETTVDAVHPNDLGFLRMADAIEPLLRGVLAHEPPA
ncbi:MAG: SGNH/GDSL hydrolase family protein [Planctomycetota bacterium]|nr:SGNH/GDSL hydrolase family protein [Planctomycetota bacterium]